MGDNEKIVGEARAWQKPYARWRLYKYANMSLHEDINSVLIMAITGLERPALQTFGNEKKGVLNDGCVEKMTFSSAMTSSH